MNPEKRSSSLIGLPQTSTRRATGRSIQSMVMSSAGSAWGWLYLLLPVASPGASLERNLEPSPWLRLGQLKELRLRRLH